MTDDTTHSKLPRIPAIVGATASGKTAIAIELAQHLPIEIVSADSRQIYKLLTIGTAKPSPDELAAVPHHFVDILYPDVLYNAGDFGNDAAKCVVDILQRGKLPVIVGGSGLYLKSLAQGLFEAEESTTVANHRRLLEQRLEKEGISPLYFELREVDPESAERYKDMNPRRIVRALEYYHATGRKISDDHKRKKIERPFEVEYVAPAHSRETLYRRINERTAAMFAAGIVEETEKVLQLGYSPALNSLNTVGYKECIAYLKGEISRQRAEELTAQKTRNYAKRQLTWFRNSENVFFLKKNTKEFAQYLKNKYISVKYFK